MAGATGHTSIRVSAAMRALLAMLVALPVFVAGVLTAPLPVKAAAPRNAEDLLIVDCLLPGQIRKLGRQATFMSARRPIRTAQADCEIRGGEFTSYDRANYQTALAVWMEQAIAGSAEAQNYVGEIYSKGLGTAPDYAMAANWFRKSADQGFKRAKINLGYLYEQGLGLEQDLARALNLYRDASGISGDELVFASTVQVQLQAKDTEISGLRQTVDEREREAATLRAEVDQLRGQLGERRRALEQSQRELDQTRSKLANARAATGADLSSLDQLRSDLNARSAQIDGESARLRAQQQEVAMRAQQAEQRLADLRRREADLTGSATPAADTEAMLAEIRAQTTHLSSAVGSAQDAAAKLQQQLAANQTLLEQQRQSYQAEIERLQAQAAGRKQEDWQLMKLLENQLTAKESEIRDQQSRIVQLEQRIGSGSIAAGGALAGAMPTLEIIDPPITATRGRPAAVLRSAPGRHEVVGKVSAPQGIDRITLNGAPTELAATGVFRGSVDVRAGGTVVQVAAVDSRGARAQLEFLIVPQEGASAAAPASSPATASGSIPPGVDLGRFHALVIGNNTYQASGWPALQSAINDATAVAQTLKERYGYKTTLLLNATRLDILTALNTLREDLGPDDNLLVYYAGHGELGSDGQQGYWIPVDGQSSAPDTWISNGSISAILDTMQARHVLVVADSCYAGAMTRSAVATFDDAVMPEAQWAAWVKTMATGRSRTALTSGGVQPVPDTGSGKHSYFARAFLNVLQDNNRLLEAQRLFREINTSLALSAMNAPVAQSPEYSPIRFAGHEAGEFFFLPRSSGRVAAR
jgi:regulator of replication initiation timing